MAIEAFIQRFGVITDKECGINTNLIRYVEEIKAENESSVNVLVKELVRQSKVGLSEADKRLKKVYIDGENSLAVFKREAPFKLSGGIIGFTIREIPQIVCTRRFNIKLFMSRLNDVLGSGTRLRFLDPKTPKECLHFAENPSFEEKQCLIRAYDERIEGEKERIVKIAAVKDKTLTQFIIPDSLCMPEKMKEYFNEHFFSDSSFRQYYEQMMYAYVFWTSSLINKL